MTAPTPHATAQFLASSHTSLMHGWVPIAVQVVAGIVLALAVGWRSRRWRTVWLPAAALVGGVAAYADALVHRRPRSLRGTRALGALALDRVDRHGRSGADPRLAQRAPLAAWRGVCGRAAVPAQCGAGAQPVGWLLPHRAVRVEPAHVGSAARSDRQGHRHRDGRQGNPALARQRGTGGDPGGRLALQASRGTRLPAARVVRQRPHRRSSRP